MDCSRELMRGELRRVTPVVGSLLEKFAQDLAANESGMPSSTHVLCVYKGRGVV